MRNMRYRAELNNLTVKGLWMYEYLSPIDSHDWAVQKDALSKAIEKPDCQRLRNVDYFVKNELDSLRIQFVQLSFVYVKYNYITLNRDFK